MDKRFGIILYYRAVINPLFCGEGPRDEETNLHRWSIRYLEASNTEIMEFLNPLRKYATVLM